MNFDLQRVLESKRALRQQLAAKPVAEKLRMLDDLRARALSLRAARKPPTAEPGLMREESEPCQARPKN